MVLPRVLLVKEGKERRRNTKFIPNFIYTLPNNKVKLYDTIIHNNKNSRGFSPVLAAYTGLNIVKRVS